MAKFKFTKVDDGYAVSYRGQVIGQINAIKEGSGRHSFYLACDIRKRPRTYRGMDRAAGALLVIDRLKKDAKKKRWSLDSLIAEAWENKPRASQQER
jgi:hypothetical protein